VSLKSPSQRTTSRFSRFLSGIVTLELDVA
jgi:hypothetical protein